ncbi:ATP synthase subunit I [Megasphaera vaginalis (ex Srinivasan et al. 2021)]|uniref:ATP synthase F0, I subunit n=1 Tax=Megasphaera vaginalis (ex Srinivasan et al. 2021) TaxID=1111454 RepID=U7UU61_9FIRM|nr:ATP synthase subunit I [Megasphaera vaginalis (ex Srinivasan et al. 2021)]ERT62003.1 ATP synthase F0, I subunit [Megasphaera vaginalis (ex Srinivasan et al. 2021)]
MDEFVRYVKKTLLRLTALTLVGAAVMAAAGKYGLLSGWFIGSLLNIVYFLMLSSRLFRSAKMQPVKALHFIRTGAVIRLLLIVLAVILVLQFPQINIFSFVGGIFTYRLLIFAETVSIFVRHSE